MAMQVHIDETVCGAMCQHPACWQSNTRQDKGFPRLHARPPTPPDIELDLPTLKVCNMLDDYGDDPFDKFPAKFGGKPSHERRELFQPPIRQQSIKVTRAPQPSPKSGSNVQGPTSKFKVVEVQEVFDPEDLQGTWDDTFVPKSYYVWVPNSKKKRRKSKLAKSEDQSTKQRSRIDLRDMTESMVPKEIEHSRLTSRQEEAFPVLKPLNENHKYQSYGNKRKKRAQSSRSPTSMRPYTLSPRSTRMEYDQDGYYSRRTYSAASFRSSFDPDRINELLDLPRDILVQVLEYTRQSDLKSREKVRQIIRRVMPPQYDRENTNLSMVSQDLLQQKKLQLLPGNKNVHESHLMDTKPVYFMDDDDMEEDEDIQRPVSPYGSFKDLYLGDMTDSREFGRYKKPLPAIPGTRAVSVGGEGVKTKIPSISLGLPELPSGIKHTKAFTYKKKPDLDFTLGSTESGRERTRNRRRGPVPTPPTSVRDTETPGSDHGTTIRVNIPSQASVQSEHGSEKRLDSCSTLTPEPLHAVSPTFSTKVPKAPATTPATNKASSPTKSAPLLRDKSSSTVAAMATISMSQEWPARENSTSPLQVLRAPVNTPGSALQEPAGLGTIHEAGGLDDTSDGIPPASRGRSVRFEIPEVPPPPSSPQLSEDGARPSSRNATVNTNVPQETPSTSTNKPASGTTFRTDVNTVNTSTLQAENSFVRSTGDTVRDNSRLSSPEPWPQINEADYERVPINTPDTTTQPSPVTTTTTTEQQHSQSEEKSSSDNKSKNAYTEREPIKIPSPDKETPSEREFSSKADYVNKTDGHTEAVKRMMEDSRKAESPAPPPPSPEPKQDSNLSAGKKKQMMTPLIEESETPRVDGDDSEMTVLQIAPRGPKRGAKMANNRQIDTFQNIDIPASSDGQTEPTLQQISKLPETDTILEEPETEQVEENNENVVNKETRDVALSVQSTLANRTISEQARSEMSSSMIEPAISQASQAPALSEDFSERQDRTGLLPDWSGVVIGSDGQETTTMLSSESKIEQSLDEIGETGENEDKDENEENDDNEPKGDNENKGELVEKDTENLDMTEEGGDHEGFKQDLRKELTKLENEEPEIDGQ